MDAGEAFILGSVIRDRDRVARRNQLIAAHVSQGHSIDSATMLVDEWLANERSKAGFGIYDIVPALFLLWVVVMACICVVGFVGGQMGFW